MRALLIFAVLCLTGQHAFADQGQCERAHKERSISGIERYCTHLKHSQNAAQRKFYYYILALTHMGKFKFGAGAADPNLQPAIDNISKAIAISGPMPGALPNDDADMYEMRGILYLQNSPPGQVISKHADKALKDFNTAIAINPKNAGYYLNRGYAHNQLLNADAAWADFQKAKTLNPSDPAIRDAWEKQRRITPEGRAEMTKKLDEITKAPSGKFTCTATIREILQEPRGATTIVVHLKAGCGIEPISLTSSPPPECVVGAKVTATGTLITEEVLFLEAERLVDVTQISCK